MANHQQSKQITPMTSARASAQVQNTTNRESYMSDGFNTMNGFGVSQQEQAVLPQTGYAYDNVRTAEAQFRNRDKIFPIEPVDLTQLSMNSQSIWQRVQNQRATDMTHYNKSGESVVSQSQEDFGAILDAQKLNEEISNFDKKFAAKGKRAFKYPNIELNRIHNPKLFKT